MDDILYSILSEMTKDELNLRCMRKEFPIPDELDENTKFVFDLVRNVCSMYQSGTRGNEIFKPFCVWDGKRSFAMEDLSGKDISVLIELDFDKLPLIIRTRIEDVLWCSSIESRYVYGQKAVDDYLEIFKDSFDPDHWTQCVEAIERGSDIAAHLGKGDERHQRCLDAAYNKVIALEGKDNLFCSIRLVKLLLGHNYADVDSILTVIDKIITNSSDIRKIERAYELKIQALKIKKQPVEKCQVEFADRYILAADKAETLDDFFNAERLHIKAIKIFEQQKLYEKKQKAFNKLKKIQKTVINNMKYYDSEMNLEKQRESIENLFEHLPIEESIVKLSSLIEYYTQDDLKKAIEENAEKDVFTYSTRKEIIDETGRVIVTIPPFDSQNEDSIRLHMYQEANEKESDNGYLFEYGIRMVRNNQGFDDNCLDYLFENNWIVPEGRENIIKKGLLHGLRGEIYEALHILAPQAEHIFRTIAKEAGAITEKVESNGTFEEKGLGSILDLPDLRDCYDNNRLFLFKGLLNEPAGANIRNRIAHSLMSEKEAESGAAYYFVGALLKLIVLASPNAYNIFSRMGSVREKTIDEN